MYRMEARSALTVTSVLPLVLSTGFSSPRLTCLPLPPKTPRPPAPPHLPPSVPSPPPRTSPSTFFVCVNLVKPYEAVLRWLVLGTEGVGSKVINPESYDYEINHTQP